MHSHTTTTCPLLQAMLLPITAATDTHIYVMFNTHQENRKSRRGKEISTQSYDIENKRWSYKSSMPAEVHDTLGNNNDCKSYLYIDHKDLLKKS